MKSKTSGLALMLALATGVLAQTPTPTQFSGVINDYSPLDQHARWVPGKCAARGL